MAKKIFFGLILAAGIFLNPLLGSAEDLKFIDAAGDTGYYVDMDSVERESAEIFSVDFIVIRADKNEMTIARLKINPSLKNYTVQSSRTLSYDERTEIDSDNTRRPTKPYSDRSLMDEVVRTILESE